jgi:hypothetical protein
VRPRWDIDERGRGVASADAYLEHADALRGAMIEPDWVAEDPDHHLLPHVRHFCEGSEVLRLDGWSIEDGMLVLDLSSDRTGRERHQAVYALIGTFAEPATLVRQLRQDRDYLVVTGVLEGDSVFAPHGHTVLVRVGGTPAAK